jgi:hypothetical protein
VTAIFSSGARRTSPPGLPHLPPREPRDRKINDVGGHKHSAPLKGELDAGRHRFALSMAPVATTQPNEDNPG